MNNSRSSKKHPRGQIRQILQALGPAFIPALVSLAPKAYFSRIRELRSPFSPTLNNRRKVLPKASLTGRHLSQEPYLRPTLYCDCHAPEIIAIAYQFRQSSSNDWDYALRIYNFVRNEVLFALEPFPSNGAVGTLEIGYGICIDKTNALIALARAGGIPARYCQISNIKPLEGGTAPFVLNFATTCRKWEESNDWRLKKIGSGMLRRIKQQEEANFENALWVREHIITELKINNAWIPADPNSSDEEAVGNGMPLPRLGYDPITLFGFSGNIVARNEALPVGRSYWIMRWLLCLLSRGMMDIINQAFEEKRQKARRLLAEIGEKEYVRRMRRYYIPLPQAVELDMSVFS
jgi:hypothetical protein